jgi:hypothetical protein
LEIAFPVGLWVGLFCAGADAVATGVFFLAASIGEAESAKAIMARNETNLIIIPSSKQQFTFLLSGDTL